MVHYFVAIALIIFVPLGEVMAGEVGVNIYGLSYHPDSDDSRGNKLNGWNPGLGLSYSFYEKGRSHLLVESGFFKDSGNEMAEYIALGYRYRMLHRISAGADLTFLHSSTVNEGDPVFAPLPVLCFRHRILSLNLIFAPKYKDINENAVFGLYATLHLFKRR